MEYMKLLSENIGLLLHEKRLTQAQLAAASGVPESSISRIRSGQAKDVELKTVNSLAKGLSVPISRLLEVQQAPSGGVPNRRPTWEETTWVLSSILASRPKLLAEVLEPPRKAKPKKKPE